MRRRHYLLPVLATAVLLAVFLRDRAPDERASMDRSPMPSRTAAPEPPAFAEVEDEPPAPASRTRVRVDTKSWPRSARVHGYVRTRDAKPVPGAEVKAEGAPAVRTNASGFYDIPSVPGKSRPVAVTASREGYDTRRRAIHVRRDDIEASFVLTGAAPIFGRVEDMAGDPVPRVYVRVSGHFGVLTGDDGGFRFPAVLDGRCELTLDPPLDGRRGPHRLLVRSADCPVLIRFEAITPGPSTLVLDIVEHGSGKRAAASATVVPADDALFPPKHSLLVERSDGALEARGLHGGAYRLHLRTKDGRRLVRSCRVADAGTTRITLPLAEPGTIVGRVRFDALPADRRPEVAKVLVVGVDRGKPASGITATVRPSEGGAFSLEAAPSLLELELQLIAPRCLGSARVTVPPRGTAQVELVAEPAGDFRFAFGETEVCEFGLSLARVGKPFAEEMPMYCASYPPWAGSGRLAPGDWRWRLRFYDLRMSEVRAVEGSVTVVAGKTTDVPVSLR